MNTDILLHISDTALKFDIFNHSDLLEGNCHFQLFLQEFCASNFPFSRYKLLNSSSPCCYMYR